VVVAVTVTFLVTLGAAPFHAAPQADKQNNGNPSILAAVHDVEHSIASVQSTVDTLTTKVDALGQSQESNVRASAPFFAAGGIGALLMACPVSNVSDVAHMVRIQLVTGQTISAEQTINLAAGASAQVVTGQGQGNLAYCKFTALDGTRSDIRGSLTVGGGFTVTLVVPAD